MENKFVKFANQEDSSLDDANGIQPASTNASYNNQVEAPFDDSHKDGRVSFEI